MIPRSEDEWKALMMGFMDRELDLEETQLVNDRLARDPIFREEYDTLCRVCGKLDRLTYDAPDETVLKALWKSPYSRFAEWGAWILILGGYGFFLCAGLFLMLTSDDDAWIVKIPILALVLGVVVLFAQKLRERLLTYSNDPYKDIEK